MDIFLDKRLPDYFTEYDWKDLQAIPAARAAAFADFMQERLSVVCGYDLGRLDRDFLCELSFPQAWAFKKLQVNDLLRGSDGPAARMVLKEGFNGDTVAFDHFINQVTELHEICFELLRNLLPSVPPEVIQLTRFSETRMENLHYDLDQDSDSHEAFRLYINLDSSPRIWATSYQMSELIARGGRRLTEGLDASLPGEAILKRISTRAYGGWHQRATERVAPRHMVYVEPGDIFFVDGRCVSHQVMSGHRVFTVYARISESVASSAGLTFGQKIRKALTQAQSLEYGAETAIVNYYQPSQLTSAGNVKEDWSQVFGQTGSGRIRRFNDSGIVRGLENLS